MKTREQMIVECIEYELERNYEDRSYVRDMLRSGFKGYDQMTDQEVKEYWDSLCQGC